MKKFTLILLFSIISIFHSFSEGFYSGDGGKNHTIMFADSTLENGIYDKSDFWITDKIRANLISVLQRYGGFKCIDLNEAKNILKIQRQLESVIYDDTQSVEIGKLVKAKEILNIKTTRLPSGSYSINISLLNVESGEILATFTSPKTYDSAESYALQAPYDCAFDLLKTLRINLTNEGTNSLSNEKRIAEEQATKNKILAKENEKIEEARSEKMRIEAERRAKIEAEERARRKAEEKEEFERNQKILAEKREREAKEKERLAQEKAKAKQQNPFANETYVCEFENGSRFDSYKIKFTSQNECTVTVTSIDSKGNEKSVTKNGSYSFGSEVLSVNVRMSNQEVKHVQKIQWKGQVTFKNGYKTFYFMIPVSSNEDARKIRGEFNLK